MSFISSTIVFTSVLWFRFALAQNDSALFNWASIQPTVALTWVDCYSKFQCTRLQVPRNYSAPNDDSAAIAVIRLQAQISASDANYRGPLFFNPGGPGGSGIEMIVESGQAIASVIGPQFDVVSFDPRGVGRSTPAASLFASDSDRAFWDFTSTNLDANATSPSIDIPRQWAQSQVLGHLAKDRDNGILAHVTTDNVARDMVTMLDAYNQTKIQYWGISYGSVLGATFATMFPDKVERLIIDGVMDMDGYYSGRWENELTDTDKTLQVFFDSCFAAGKSLCPFYASSADEISKNLNALLESVRKQPVPVYSKETSSYGIVDYATLKYAVEHTLYSPYPGYAILAGGLADLAVGNGTVILGLANQFAFGHSCASTSLDPLGDMDNVMDAEIAVACGDFGKITDTAQDLEVYYENIKNISIFADFLLPQRIRCSGWQLHPDRFHGPTGGNTSFPLLLIGNTADPVTPVANAYKTSKNFTNSVVLTQDSPGHTSFAAVSLCTYGYVQAYLLNGTFPAKGTVCPVDDVPFSTASSNVTTRAYGGLGEMKTGMSSIMTALGKVKSRR